MNPKFGRRSWVKLWVNEWLEGTTRLEMSDAQRAFWIDLLALAGRSRFPGIICAGLVGEQHIGYPLAKFEALLTTPIDVAETFALFERNGKIQMVIDRSREIPLYTVHLLNWSKFQSEYQRQKPYRNKSYKQQPPQGYKPSYNNGNNTEGEVEGEVEEETHSVREFATPEFLKFWEAYPLKLDKPEAIRQWFRIPFADKSLETILVGLNLWKSSGRWDEERYIPSPAKFLKMRRWESTPPRKGETKNEERRRKTKEAISRVREASHGMA